MSDDDSDEMMHSMMGFSSFGTQRPIAKKPAEAPSSTSANAVAVASRPAKKAKIEADAKAKAPATTAQTPTTQLTQRSDISQPSTSNTEPEQTETTLPSISARYDQTTTTSSTSPMKRTANLPPKPVQPPASSAPAASTSSNRIIYTSPFNASYTLTQSDLNALSRGKRNTKGDTVYFKPSFVDTNPWKELQDKMEVRKVKREMKHTKGGRPGTIMEETASQLEG